MSAEAVELRKIRDRYRALDGTRWQLCCVDNRTFVEAKTRNGELVEIANFHPVATPDEIDFLVSAPDMVGFLLGLVDRAIAASRKAAPVRKKQRVWKGFAAEAAMKCDQPSFRIYLEERHGAEGPLTAESAVDALRAVLRIKSRKELNSDAAAADRWSDLRADFEVWLRVGR